MGNYSDALIKLSRCLNLKQELEDKRGEGLALLGLGGLYTSIGDYDHAHDSYTQGLPIFHSLGLPLERTMLKYLGQLYCELGKYDTANIYFQRGLNMAKSSGDEWVDTSIILAIGKAHLDRHQYQAAIDSLVIAEKFVDRMNQTENQILFLSWLGYAELELGRTSDAQSHVAQIEKLSEKRQIKPTLIEVCWTLHRIYAKLGNDAKAVHYLHLAYEELDRRAKNIQESNLRQSYLSKVKDNREIVAAWNNYLANKK
jgi:tetratricopeptide (TPR) repeat protein